MNDTECMSACAVWDWTTFFYLSVIWHLQRVATNSKMLEIAIQSCTSTMGLTMFNGSKNFTSMSSAGSGEALIERYWKNPQVSQDFPIISCSQQGNQIWKPQNRTIWGLVCQCCKTVLNLRWNHDWKPCANSILISVMAVCGDVNWYPVIATAATIGV